MLNRKTVFSIDIYEDLNARGRSLLAEWTSNPEILAVLSEDSFEYTKGAVVQNINTPIHILEKMLNEYDKVILPINESYYSGYRKENIEKTLKLIKRKLGKDQFEKSKRIGEILYSGKYFI